MSLTEWLRAVPLGAFEDPQDGLPSWLARYCPQVTVAAVGVCDEVVGVYLDGKQWVRPGLRGQQVLVVRSEQWHVFRYPGSTPDAWQSDPAWYRPQKLLEALHDETWVACESSAGDAAVDLARQVRMWLANNDGGLPQPGASGWQLPKALTLPCPPLVMLGVLLDCLSGSERASVETLIALQDPRVGALLSDWQVLRDGLLRWEDVTVQLREGLGLYGAEGGVNDSSFFRRALIEVLAARPDRREDVLNAAVSRVLAG